MGELDDVPLGTYSELLSHILLESGGDVVGEESIVAQLEVFWKRLTI